MEFDALLRRERVVVGVLAAVLALLAWMYIWRGAGMGMSALNMTELALFPHTRPEPMPGMEAPPFAWDIAVAMWWVMMIAMMTPSATPLVLLYGRVVRHTTMQMQDADRSAAYYAPPVFLILGYLLVWFGFSLMAAATQFALQRLGLISDMMLWSRSAAFSAAILLGAGIYQFSPFKRACLRQCRGPVEFLTRHWRPGRSGAFIMGVRHGAWCVGCCWMLMALLLVGGVMNLVWIALLALLVLVEKLAPRGIMVSRAAGVVLLAWGLATLAA